MARNPEQLRYEEAPSRSARDAQALRALLQNREVLKSELIPDFAKFQKPGFALEDATSSERETRGEFEDEVAGEAAQRIESDPNPNGMFSGIKATALEHFEAADARLEQANKDAQEGVQRTGIFGADINRGTEAQVVRDANRTENVDGTVSV